MRRRLRSRSFSIGTVPIVVPTSREMAVQIPVEPGDPRNT